ncbi:MAG: glycyl radical protein [Burkholderiales bacterium]|nr:glycyl radical protein [Burkholderiales bacterium]
MDTIETLVVTPALQPPAAEKGARILTPQEKRIESGHEFIRPDGTPAVSGRIARMLKGFRDQPPRVAVQRAQYMVESLRSTDGLAPVLRWARALANVMSKIEVSIGEDELIVGRCGPSGRYGILYPELRGAWLEKGLETLTNRKEGAVSFTDEDARIIREEIVPYWKGRTVFEAHYAMVPDDTRRILYRDEDPYTPRYFVLESTTDRTALQWSLDYEKILKRGFNGIKREAEERLAACDPFDASNNIEKMPFYRAVIVVCDAMVNFARRYAELARSMAAGATPERARELREIAEICEWVPGNPARSFREAVQAQWFAQVGSRFETFHGGNIGNGRIDQYLYSYYKTDRDAGRITDEEVLELLEHLWLNMAQCICFRQSGSIAHQEAYPHFEHTTIGGQTEQGIDASNELSYLVLQSKKDFPLDYPDLSARIHARTPERFLHKICEVIKEGTGFPKLMNDEAIIPLLLAKGASLHEARNYAGSGCTEVRMLNRDTYMTGNSMVNLAIAVEMALNDGRVRLSSDERFGVATGDPCQFHTFADVLAAFKRQVEHLVRHTFIQNRLADTIRPRMLAAPLESSLHDLCMKHGLDIHQGKIPDGIVLGSWDPIGFGTAVDSLAAIKKLVFDDKKVTMRTLTSALASDFDGCEALRQMCVNAPKFGDNNPYVDDIAVDLENYFRSLSAGYTNLFGGKMDVRSVPITAYMPLGRVVGATPNGRKATQPISDGISPSQGCDTKGPTAVLMSVARLNESKYHHTAAKLLNMKLSPQTVQGREGTRRLAALIRSWCDLKLWHIQFNIINNETLRAAQRDPEKYRNLLVRVAGYSAYFVDLTPGLQDEIIRRTEGSFGGT